MTPRTARPSRTATARNAFTLVEILIVVVVLGIVAAIALPRFSNASAAARASMLADDLRLMRMQIAVFRAQHMGVAPGYPDCDPDVAATEAAFIAHMTQSSNADGATAAPGTPGFRYGPYFREMPANPVNAKATVQIIPDGASLPASADDSHGYVYRPSTLTIKGDSAGTDENGKLFFDY